jgi:hypothetical protein
VFKNCSVQKIRSFLTAYWKSSVFLQAKKVVRKPVISNKNIIEDFEEKVIPITEKSIVSPPANSQDTDRFLHITSGDSTRPPICEFLIQLCDLLSLIHKTFEYSRRNKSRNSAVTMNSDPKSAISLIAASRNEEPSLLFNKGTLPSNLTKKKAEGILAHEVSNILLDVYFGVLIPIFSEHIEKHWKSKTGVRIEAEHIVAVRDELQWLMVKFLAAEQSNAVFCRILSGCVSLSQYYSAVIFDSSLISEESKVCFKFWYTVIKRSAISSEEVRVQAVKLIYKILNDAFTVRGSMTRCRLPLLTAFMEHVSAAVTKKQVGKFSHLFESVKYLKTLAPPVTSMQGSKHAFRIQLHSLCDSLLNMMLLRVTRVDSFQKFVDTKIYIDSEAVVDAYIEIYHSMEITTEVKIYFLKELRDYHLNLKNFNEAGRCLVEVASLMHHLFNRQKSSKLSDQIQETLIAATALFDKGEPPLPEYAVKILKIQEAMLRKEVELRNSVTMGSVLPKLSEVQRRLIQFRSKVLKFESESAIRLFGTYYRVGFYGKPFGKLHKKEFVYKQTGLTQLAQMKTILVSTYEKLCESGVQVIFDTNPINEEKYDFDKQCFIQLNAVEPAPMISNPTNVEKNIDINSFMFFTPFTLSGKPHGSILEQHKRKTVLKTAEAFPYLGTRIPVFSKTETILLPIQVAIEDVKSRNNLLSLEISPSGGGEPSFKTLSQVLNGSVCVQVNGGSTEICDAFLGEQKQDVHDPSDILALKTSLRRFLDLVRTALPICRSLCKSESHLSLQEEFEKGFETLQKQIGKYLI